MPNKFQTDGADDGMLVAGGGGGKAKKPSGAYRKPSAAYRGKCTLVCQDVVEPGTNEMELVRETE